MVDFVVLLGRMPRWVQRFALRIAAGRGLLGSAADRVRYRYSKDQVPHLSSSDDAKVRLLIGPANSAGQGNRWARAVERCLPEASAFAIRGIGADSFRPEVDLTVPVAVYQRSAAWHEDFERFLVSRTHVIWESGLPLLGRRYNSDVRNEILLLNDHRVQGALMFHGSDIRPPLLHAMQSAWSPFSVNGGRTWALNESVRRNAALAAESGLPVFVSTPDLLQWVPEAKWCPVVIDIDRWQSTDARTTSTSIPVVAHAPSQSWLKGTDWIEPVLRRLSDEGVIEYRQVKGIPHESMPNFYADADIVLDQFMLGSYGVAACEAMASGRIVMGHVDSATRASVLELTGLSLPVHEATVASLEAELRFAAAHPQAFDELRHAGPAYVEAVHGGRRSAATLAAFLGFSP